VHTTPALRLALAAAALGAVAVGTFLARGRDAPHQRSEPAGRPTLARLEALLSGRVVDAETDEGVPGATILIDHSAGILKTRTDGKGRYRAIVDTTRPIALTADAAGYKGAAAFGRLCPGDTTTFTLLLVPASAPAPLPPQTIPGGDDCT
jgi:hypothetical protein